MVCHSDEPDLVPLRQTQVPLCSKPPSPATRVRLSRGSLAHAFHPEQLQRLGKGGVLLLPGTAKAEFVTFRRFLRQLSVGFEHSRRLFEGHIFLDGMRCRCGRPKQLPVSWKGQFLGDGSLPTARERVTAPFGARGGDAGRNARMTVHLRLSLQEPIQTVLRCYQQHEIAGRAARLQTAVDPASDVQSRCRATEVAAGAATHHATAAIQPNDNTISLFQPAEWDVLSAEYPLQDYGGLLECLFVLQIFSPRRGPKAAQ